MIQASNIDFNKGATVLNASFQPLATPPAIGAVPSQLYYYDTVKKSLGVYDVATTTWIYYSISQNSLSLLLAPTGALSMAGFKITSGGLGVATTDFATIQNILNTRLDQLAAPAASVSMNAQKITGLALGTAQTDAASVLNVQNALDVFTSGMSTKPAVRLMSNVNINTAAAPTTYDSVTANVGDRILLTGQTAQTQNGSYVYSAGLLTRAADSLQNFEMQEGAQWYIQEGTTFGGQTWRITTLGVITIGTTSINMTVVAGSGQNLTAGAGITFTASVVSQTAGYSTRRYSVAIGNGSLTSFVVTHALNVPNGVMMCLDATGNAVGCDMQWTSTTTATFSGFVAIPTANQFTAVCIG